MRTILGGFGVLLVAAAWLGGTAAPAMAQQPTQEPRSLADVVGASVKSAKILEEAEQQETAAKTARDDALHALNRARAEIPAPNSTPEQIRIRNQRVDAATSNLNAAAEVFSQRTVTALQAGRNQAAAATALLDFVTEHPGVRSPAANSAMQEATRWLQDTNNNIYIDRRGPATGPVLAPGGTPFFGTGGSRPQQDQLPADIRAEEARLKTWKDDLLRRALDWRSRTDAHNRREPMRGNYPSVESYNNAVRAYNIEKAALDAEQQTLSAEGTRLEAARRALTERSRPLNGSGRAPGPVAYPDASGRASGPVTYPGGAPFVGLNGQPVGTVPNSFQQQQQLAAQEAELRRKREEQRIAQIRAEDERQRREQDAAQGALRNRRHLAEERQRRERDAAQEEERERQAANQEARQKLLAFAAANPSFAAKAIALSKHENIGILAVDATTESWLSYQKFDQEKQRLADQAAQNQAQINATANRQYQQPNTPSPSPTITTPPPPAVSAPVPPKQASHDPVRVKALNVVNGGIPK